MQCIGVMCAYLPIKGTFIHYSARYVDPALGFASSLIYIYTCMMFVCIEATAVAQLIDTGPILIQEYGSLSAFCFTL